MNRLLSYLERFTSEIMRENQPRGKCESRVVDVDCRYKSTLHTAI